MAERASWLDYAEKGGIKANEISFASVGLGRLQEILERFPLRHARKVLHPTVSSVAQVVLSRVRSLSPRKTGSLRRAWHKKTKWYGHSLTSFAIVKANYSPFKTKPGYAPHTHIIEKGTEPRYTKIGAKRGIGPAFHMMARTQQTVGPRVEARLTAQVLKRLEAEIRKEMGE